MVGFPETRIDPNFLVEMNQLVCLKTIQYKTVVGKKYENETRKQMDTITYREER